MFLRQILLACLVVTSSALPLERALQDADCGQIIGTLLSDEVRAIGKSFLSQFLTDENDLLQRSTNIIFMQAQYDINIVKLCASCQDHADWYYERNSLVFPGYHSIYCNTNDRATYAARTSAIALVPRYDTSTTHGLPANFKLRTFLTMPPTQITGDGHVEAASDSFVSFLSAWGSNSSFINDTHFFSTYLPGMAAAVAGSISLFPDYLSAKNAVIGRTIFRKRSYEHATAVSYLALERYVMDTSAKCTLLDKAVTIYGNDVDAAYGATVATLVLQRFGVACLGAFLSTGLLDLPILLQDAIRASSTANNLTTGSSTDNNMKLWLQLAAHTIASTDRTYDADVNWISDKYRDSLEQTYNPDSTTTDSSSNTNGSISVLSTTNLPSNVSELFHPTVIEALRTYNSSDWDLNQKDLNCDRFSVMNTTGSVAIASNITNTSAIYEKVICQLRAKYSVYNVLLGQTDRPWISNVSACYSNMDEIISGTKQYEYSGIVQTAKFVEQYWKRYTQPIGLDSLAVTNQDHATAVQLCTVAPLLFLTLDGHRPVNMEAWSNFAPPMTSEESLQCSAAGTPPTDASGEIPAAAPVNPTIVTQPSSVSPPEDSNPTIISSPTVISPSDSNPTIVSQPTGTSPTEDIVLEGRPTTNEKDENNDERQTPNSNSSGVLELAKRATILQASSIVFVALIPIIV